MFFLLHTILVFVGIASAFVNTKVTILPDIEFSFLYGRTLGLGDVAGANPMIGLARVAVWHSTL